MNGYTIDPAAASQVIQQLTDILDELSAEIGRLETTKEDLLSDANWQGPNKQQYRAEFNAYLDAARQLLANGVEHLEALEGMANTYVENEL